MDPYSTELLWMVIVGWILAFLLSFAIGANDVSNSFGTSVGSGVLTFKQACILAAIFETAGAVLLGYKVSDTIRKGVIDVTLYEGTENVLVIGMLAALIGSFAWIMIATYIQVPVSTTHSIVAAIVGFSLVAHGGNGLNTSELIKIIISWFVSPVASGAVALVIYTAIKFLIIRTKNPFSSGLISLPIIYGLTIFVNLLAITLGGSKLLGMDNLKLWMCFVISIAAGIVVAVATQFFLVPWQRAKVLRSIDAVCSKDDPEDVKNVSKDVEIRNVDVQFFEPKGNEIASEKTSPNGSTTQLTALPASRDYQLVERLFHFLQTLSAVFTSFAHGGNDVSNSIGPLITIWSVYLEGSVAQKSEAKIYLLFYGAVGMIIGLAILGRRVNDTVGKKITKITPTIGFTVETAAATTVLIASKIGVPVSTTHCVVGSVVALGYVYGETNDSGTRVNWKLFVSIFSAWVITLPAAGGISALVMYFFKLGFKF